MQPLFGGGAAACQLLLMLAIGSLAVFMVSRVLEQRMGRKKPSRGPSALDALGWLWDYSNLIGIPVLLAGAAYLLWSLNWGPGLSTGPTMLVVLLMMVAAFLIGFGPSLRR